MGKLSLYFIIFITITYQKVSPHPCDQKSLPQGDYEFYQPPQSLLQEIDQLFPESYYPTHSVDLKDVFYPVSGDSTLEVIFLHRGGVFPTTIGYYVFDEFAQESERNIILFPAADCAKVGDFIRIGFFEAGTKIGFYILVDQNSSFIFWSHQTKNNSNADGISHVSHVEIQNLWLVGFEDFYAGGDRDFNDVILGVRVAEDAWCSRQDFEACYEGASIMIVVASVFLGFAGAAVQTLVDKRKGVKRKKKVQKRRLAENPPRHQQILDQLNRLKPYYQRLIKLTVVSMVALLVALAVAIAARLALVLSCATCILTIVAGCVAAVGFVLLLTSFLYAYCSKQR